MTSSPYVKRNDSIKLTDILLRDYTFASSKNPDMAKAACSLKIISPLRSEMMSFDQSIVVELIIGRSPGFNRTSPESMDFLSHFNNLYSKIKNENPYASFFYWGF